MRTGIVSLILIFILITGIVITFFVFLSHPALAPTQDTPPSNTQTPQQQDPVAREVRAFGSVELPLKQMAQFDGVSITPLEILEDSRCPVDVQCIWAGTSKVLLQTVSGLGTSTDTLALGDSLTTEAERITFLSIMPERVSTETAKEDEYLLTFEVVKRTAIETAPPAAPSLGPCYIGGCSSQLCSDSPDLASTCEYREEYACYREAVCERQQNGQCGWTQTSELNACLYNAQ